MLPLAILLLVLGHLAEEEPVVKLLLSLLNHLGELVRDCVADTLEEIRLLLAQNGHRVLGESDENTLVAEALVAHVLEVGVALLLQERLEVIVVQGVKRPQRAQVHIQRLIPRRGGRVARLGILAVLRRVIPVF